MKKFNKKAQTDVQRILQYLVVRIPVVLILAVVFNVFYARLVGTALTSHRINDLALAKRISYSPYALAYTDPKTGRVYPGIIDLDKITQENLEMAFLFEGTNVAAKIQIQTLEGRDIKIFYINKNWFERWEPYTKFGSYDKNMYRKPVQIIQKGKTYPGIMTLYQVSPNE